MPLKQRVIETVYRIKDAFTGPLGKIVSWFKRVRDESRKTSDALADDNRRTSKVFNSSIGAVTRFAGVFAGAFSLSRAAAGFQSFVDNVDRLAKTGQRLGITTEALSELEFVAGRYGISQNKLELGLQRMTRRVAEAAQGMGEAQKALKELGLDAEQLATLAPDQQFKRIAEAMSLVGDQSDRVRLGFKLFDSEGVALINTMQQGAEGIEKMTARARALGKTVSEETAKEIEEFKDALQDLQTVTDSIGRKVGEPLARALTAVLKGETLPDFITGRQVDRITEINRELDELNNKLARARKSDEGIVGAVFGGIRDEYVDKILADIRRLQDEKDNLERRSVDISNTARKRHRDIARLQLADQEYAAREEKRLGDEKLAALKKSLQARESAYKRHGGKVRELLQAEKDIQQEFNDLAQDLTKQTAEAIEDPDLGDVNDIIGRAFIDISDGNFDQAIERLRQGGEYLKTMQEEGRYLATTLSGVAQQLGEVARQAAEGKTEATLIDVDKEQANIDEIKNSIKKLEAGVAQNKVTIPIVIDDQDITQQIEAVRKRITAEPIIIKVQTQNGVGFTDEQTAGRSLSDEVLQWGSR